MRVSQLLVARVINSIRTYDLHLQSEHFYLACWSIRETAVEVPLFVQQQQLQVRDFGWFCSSLFHRNWFIGHCFDWLQVHRQKVQDCATQFLLAHQIYIQVNHVT